MRAKAAPAFSPPSSASFQLPLPSSCGLAPPSRLCGAERVRRLWLHPSELIPRLPDYFHSPRSDGASTSPVPASAPAQSGEVRKRPGWPTASTTCRSAAVAGCPVVKATAKQNHACAAAPLTRAAPRALILRTLLTYLPRVQPPGALSKAPRAISSCATTRSPMCSGLAITADSPHVRPQVRVHSVVRMDCSAPQAHLLARFPRASSHVRGSAVIPC